MTASVKRVDRSYVRNLISSADCISLTVEEQKTFDHCLMLTSILWVGAVDGRLACTWGLVPPTLMSDRAYLWLYTTPEVEDHKFLFVRHSQRAMEEMLETYPIITGVTKVGWTQTIRWLRWLGAEFGDHHGQFLPFEIRKR